MAGLVDHTVFVKRIDRLIRWIGPELWQRSGVFELVVAHDDACPMMHGKRRCRCEPDFSMAVRDAD